MSKLYRHGDVLIEQVDALPEGVQPREDLILARGESTGHAHQVKDPATAHLFAGLDDMLYLQVVAPVAQLVHEEHATIELPEGIYKVWQQREYHPEAPRRVYD